MEHKITIVGIGPGAHGRLTLDGTKYATRAHRAPEAWLEGTPSQPSELEQQAQQSQQ